jgi:hypothetical protein
MTPCSMSPTKVSKHLAHRTGRTASLVVGTLGKAKCRKKLISSFPTARYVVCSTFHLPKHRSQSLRFQILPSKPRGRLPLPSTQMALRKCLGSTDRSVPTDASLSGTGHQGAIGVPILHKPGVLLRKSAPFFFRENRVIEPYPNCPVCARLKRKGRHVDGRSLRGDRKPEYHSRSACVY